MADKVTPDQAEALINKLIANTPLTAPELAQLLATVQSLGAAVAVLTSVRAVLANPLVMAAWGLIVGALLFIGSIPFFFGLAVVVPVLGHATWHLYRRMIDPGDAPVNEYHETPKGRRYAADFPAALFPWGRHDRQP